MEEQGALALALLVSKVDVVKPPGGRYAGYCSVLLLLPVEPPEVNALLFQRMVNQVHVVGGEFLVGDVEGDVFLRCRIDAHGFGHCRISLLPWLDAGGRMEVERGLQALGVDMGKKIAGIG